MTSMIKKIDLSFLPTTWIPTNNINFSIAVNNDQFILVNHEKNQSYKMPITTIPLILIQSQHLYPNNMPASIYISLINSDTLFMLTSKVNTFNKITAEITMSHFDIGQNLKLIKKEVFEMDFCHKDCVYHNFDNNKHCNNSSKIAIVNTYLIIGKLFNNDTYVIYNLNNKLTTCIININNLKINLFNDYSPELTFISYINKISYFLMTNTFTKQIKILNLESGQEDTYDNCDLTKIQFTPLTFNGVVQSYKFYIINDSIKTIIIDQYNVISVKNTNVKFDYDFDDEKLKIMATYGYDSYETILTSINHPFTNKLKMLNKIVSDALNNRSSLLSYKYDIDDDNIKLTINYDAEYIKHVFNFELKKEPVDDLDVIRRRLDNLELNLIK